NKKEKEKGVPVAAAKHGEPPHHQHREFLHHRVRLEPPLNLSPITAISPVLAGTLVSLSRVFFLSRFTLSLAYAF
ncbi:hypothetical protein A2U01_0099270, partial [Trifolium medium]|nr:hypothetical protein [Trifolium medium]